MFSNKTVQLATRPPKNLQEIIAKAKFQENTQPPPVKEFTSCCFFFCEHFENTLLVAISS